ncbi:MAG TPA: hypothetical protein VK464_27845, partial [Symbiobacteriaceae bacterium]|nr:hypothetical protein [Symbiobacteriaceae bacterium]
MPTVMALFQHAHDAERAISELSLIGFTEKDVSMVMFSANPASHPGKKGFMGWLSRGGLLGDTVDSTDGISVLDGTGVGAVICSLIGTILGSEWRYGPVATGTAGLVAGGIIGFLIDRLIPEKRR